MPETEVSDLLDLPVDQRNGALHEAALISRVIKQELGCPKINFAAIGNIVPQLHMHVVGRKAGDACWPMPVWGHLIEGPSYSAARIAELTGVLAQRYSLRVD